MTSIGEIDSAIYLVLGTHQLKIAKVVAFVSKELVVPQEVVAERLKALTELKKLQGFGNLDNWRSSEVRVKSK